MGGALREELRLPWVVMGPLVRAPLAREAWICFRDLILMSVSDGEAGGTRGSE